MKKTSPSLDWCIVRCDNNNKWWVDSISDTENWDIENLGIIDPKQFIYINELLDSMTEFGLQSQLVDEAFFTFEISEEVPDKKVKLERVRDSLLKAEDLVFALTDVLDEEKGPYADFLNHVTQIRVTMLNDLIEFSELIREGGQIDCGLATDGDADRIGLYNAKGQFIDSHHIILLLIHYLVKYKGMTGKIVTAFSCSVKVAQMCMYYGLEHEIVKVGFKHVAGVMLKEDVLLGGEESGGVAIKGHIPERDGIWMGLVIWEYMAKTGKSLDDLIQEVYDIVGEFAFERIDLNLEEAKKVEIVENCKNGVYTAFGDMPIVKTETIDGFKFYFDEDSWIMIRPSGTEPVLRTYAEAKNQDKCFEILKKVHQALLD